jgi:hypothetical protein
MYCLDHDYKGREQRISVLDRVTGALLDERLLTNFSGGKYVRWDLSGKVRVLVSRVQGPDAMVSGVFFDTVPNASLHALDAASSGNWRGTYGSGGGVVLGDSTNMPAYATIALGNAEYYPFDLNSVSGALQPVTDSRVTGCWFTHSNLTMDVKLSGPAARQVTLYSLDIFKGGRIQRLDATDVLTGELLFSHTASAFDKGLYVGMDMQGWVRLTLTTLTPTANAIVNGLFFDTSQPELSVQNAGTNGCRLLIHGQPECLYRVEVSPDLSSWMPLHDVKGEELASPWVDPVGQSPKRFYRAVRLPK